MDLPMNQPKQPPEWEREFDETFCSVEDHESITTFINPRDSDIKFFISRTLTTEREKVLKEVVEGLPEERRDSHSYFTPVHSFSTVDHEDTIECSHWNECRTAVLTYLQTLAAALKRTV